MNRTRDDSIPRPQAADLERLRRLAGDDAEAAAALARLEAALAATAPAAGLHRNLGHELRTPLNAILGFAQLLRQDPALSSQQHTQVDIIHRSGEQLLGLLNDALASARPDGDVRTPLFDLHQLLDDLEDMLYLRAERRGLRLRLVRAPDLPRLVRTDGARLRQLLLLLLGNAIKLSPAGDPTGGVLGLHLDCERDRDEPTRAQLRCELAAPGLSDPAALEAFVDTDAGLSGREGTGLSLGQEFARLLAGELSLAEGRVRALLPVGLAPLEDLSSGPDRRVVGLAPGQPVYRVLIAEDRWQSRQLLVQTLARVGFEVREAADGAEALAAWDTWRPDLIWMDMRMPGVTGLEATQKIKQGPRGAATIVIALTASAFDEDAATARAAGCDDFVRKPIVLAQVFAKLSEHLGCSYIYESDQAGPLAEAPALAPAVDLAGLPAPWLVAVQRAAVQADVDELTRLVDEIRPERPAAAAALGELSGRFGYDVILRLAAEALAHPSAGPRPFSPDGGPA
ncbi:MAG: response regulator [Myxococcales bacterium]|nr:response regulator [Myxococcales bacterium]